MASNFKRNDVSKVICRCAKCAIYGGKLICSKTADMHVLREETKKTNAGKIQPKESEVSTASTPSVSTSVEVGDTRTKPLYRGSEVNLLQAVAMLLSIQGLFPGVSQRATSEMLRILHHFILPKGNILPDSFAAAKRVVADLLIPVREFDVCPNDHVLFDGELRDSLQCPQCKEKRYKEGTKKPQKRFRYIPLIPRLQRWFSMPAIASSLKAHTDIPASNPVSDIHMSPAWKNLFKTDGPFEGDGRCLSFAVSADGFDPFNHQKVQYSICPVLIKCLNFNSKSRDKIGRMLLSSIVPGPSGPLDMNPYLSPLVDELKQLEAGVDCFDASTSENFKLKARIIMGIFDNPGSSKVLKSAGPGSLINSCRHCDIKGEWNPYYQKVIYLENRRHLCDSSSLRVDTVGFGSEEKRPRHSPTSKEEQVRNGGLVADLKRKVFTEPTERDRKKARTAATKLEKLTGKKGLEDLARLGYYSDVDIPVELMHTVQVVMKKFFGLFTGRDFTAKLRTAEVTMGRHQQVIDQAPWTLTAQQKIRADERLLEITVPSDFDWHPKKLFTPTALPYMKCSDWKKLATHGILKYIMRGMLGEVQRETFFRLCDVLRDITDYTVNLDDLPAVDEEIHEVLSLIERDFPLSMQTLCMHILHHTAPTLQKYGPATSQWMYGFERFMSFLSGRILNRKEPEVNAVEAYRIYEFSQFMAMSGDLPQGSICTSNSLTVLAANEQTAGSTLDEKSHTVQGKRPPTQILLDKEQSQYLQSRGTSSKTASKVFLAQREHPRCQKYTCREIDTNKTVVSSFIAGRFTTGGTLCNKLGEGYLFFGQVLYFLLCRADDGSEQEYAMVEWQPKPVNDDATGLWKVPPGHHAIPSSLVSLQLLSPPLVKAKDADGVLWFLDFKEKYINTIA